MLWYKVGPGKRGSVNVSGKDPHLIVAGESPLCHVPITAGESPEHIEGGDRGATPSGSTRVCLPHTSSRDPANPAERVSVQEAIKHNAECAPRGNPGDPG